MHWRSHVPSRRYRRLASVLLPLFSLVGLSLAGTGEPDLPSDPSPLAALREAVAANEAKATLIRMEYQGWPEQSIDVPQHIRVPQMPNSKRGPGRLFTGSRSLWAQDGARLHSTVSYYVGEEMDKSNVIVSTGEVIKRGRLPDLMEGAISPIDRFRWMRVEPVALGLRPYGNEYTLSQLLLPQYARLCDESAVIDGRKTVVVEIRSPTPPARVVRVWIDAERHVPLRIEHYRLQGKLDRTKPIVVVDSIRVHQLPNKGWIPVAGKRSSPMERGGWEWIESHRIAVDVDSISIEKKDIPDSLFDIKFPEGARIRNTIVGLAHPPDLEIDAMAREVLDEIADEVRSENAEAAPAPAVDAEPILMAASPNEGSAVAFDEQRSAPGGQTVEASSVTSGSFPFVAVAASIALLLFGGAGVAYALRSRNR